MSESSQSQFDRQALFSSSISRFKLRPLPVMSVFNRLHCGEGAALTLHRKAQGHWENLGALAVSKLRATWPMVAAHLNQDAYFLINSTHAREDLQRVCELTGLPCCSRKAEHLRWLNAIFVDIDVHQPGKSCRFDELLEGFAVETHKIGMPKPNLLSSSGRGLWGLWMLRDHSNLKNPVPAFPERLEVYRRVNQALAVKLSPVGADPTATDSSRVMRIPGSINTRAPLEQCVVQFFSWSRDLQTLPEPADILGVRARKVSLSGERSRPKNKAKVNAGLGRWRKPLDGFRQLWNMRGHFEDGVRNHAAYVLAYLLRRNRVSEAAILDQCSRLGRSCTPALARDRIWRCVSSSAKAANEDFGRSMSNATIARMLKITPEEMAALPKWFKPSRQRKSKRVAARRAIIMQELQLASKWVPKRGQWLPSRAMARLLLAKHGIKVSHVTLTKDYRLLYEAHFSRPCLVTLARWEIHTLSLCTSNENLTALKPVLPGLRSAL